MHMRRWRLLQLLPLSMQGLVRTSALLAWAGRIRRLCHCAAFARDGDASLQAHCQGHLRFGHVARAMWLALYWLPAWGRVVEDSPVLASPISALLVGDLSSPAGVPASACAASIIHVLRHFAISLHLHTTLIMSKVALGNFKLQGKGELHHSR